MGMAIAFFIAFIAEGLGVAIGILLVCIFNIKNQRLIGMLFGLTAGVMLSMICFDILPEAISTNRFELVVLGMLIGVGLGLSLQQVIHFTEDKLLLSNSKMLKTGLALLIGIGIHSIPEGFALGSLSYTSQETILNFATVICLHSIPEAIAVAIPLKGNVKTSFMFLIPVCLGLAMGIGAILGYFLSKISDVFIVISLGIAAGIILYIICEDLLPESKHIWNGRLTSVATVIGVILGIILLF
ncbi:MAG: zinc permease [Epulopiscium sp. Nuni2H_MBin003]|nr:MAG: zinc permease [Epulopiscium sp. Nuni2H_MBin003]